jgi:HlyD family secretion protein
VRRIFIIAGIVVVLVAIAVGLYFYFRPSQPSNIIILYGNVDVRQVDLGFRVGGRVISMPWQEGDYICPGTLMAELDKQPYADEVDQARANVTAIKPNLLYAEQVLARRRALLRLGDGSVSVEDYENALSTRNALAANLAAAEAALGVALTNFCDTEVYAPSEGVILTRIREPGTVVRIADPVYTLSLVSPIWVRAFVPEPLLGVVYPGMRAQVFTDIKNGPAYEGHVGFISPVAEFTPKTVETTQLRTHLVYRLRIITENPDHGLRQGMPVTVKLTIDQPARQQNERSPCAH